MAPAMTGGALLGVPRAGSQRAVPLCAPTLCRPAGPRKLAHGAHAAPATPAPLLSLTASTRLLHLSSEPRLPGTARGAARHSTSAWPRMRGSATRLAQEGSNMHQQPSRQPQGICLISARRLAARGGEGQPGALAPAARQAVELADVGHGHDGQHDRDGAGGEHGHPQVAQHVHRVAAHQRLHLRAARRSAQGAPRTRLRHRSAGWVRARRRAARLFSAIVQR
jgi:hypothetical protein